MHIPFIDVHSHHRPVVADCLTVYNVIVGKDAWEGQVCTAGIHPWHIAPDTTAQWKQLQELIQQETVIGIGECGLDKMCNTPWELQIGVFETQIEWANRIKKPLIIHCVRAYQEVLELLAQKKVQVPVIFHGFNKKSELAQRILKEGYYLSLGANSMYGRHDALLSSIPLDRMFLETDNNTTNIVDIFSYFCAARKMEVVDLKKQMVRNLEQVFKYSI